MEKMKTLVKTVSLITRQEREKESLRVWLHFFTTLAKKDIGYTSYSQGGILERESVLGYHLDQEHVTDLIMFRGSC